MGNQNEGSLNNSLGGSQIDEDQDFYILEELGQVSLKGDRSYIYYWIDPKIFNNENMKYSTYLRKYVDLEGFSSLEGMYSSLADQIPDKKIRVICAASLTEEEYGKLQKDPLIPNMFLFCQNQEKAKLLMINFPKIKVAKFDVNDLKDCLLQTEVQESETDPKTNILFMIEEDTNMLNKFRLIYHCLTNNSISNKAKQDFIKFVSQLYPEEKAEIDVFASQFKIGLNPDDRATQAIQWAFMNNFFINSVQALPKITTDPKKLAYLRFPFKQIQESIIRKYKNQPKSISEIYLVLELNKDEKKYFEENLKNFIIFTSFVKGYTTEKKASEQFKKSKDNFMVRIMLTKNKKDEELDFGFIVDKGVEKGPNVLINIYNFFKIDEYEEELRQITLSYGALAELSYKRKFQRTTRLDPFEERLIRNFDYVEDIMRNANSQAKVLQMSGHLRDSLEIYSHKIQFIRKSQPPKEVIEKHIIEMGDAYRINEDFDRAIDEYNKVTSKNMKTIALVHLAELYLKLGQVEKMEALIPEIKQGISILEANNKPESFNARNFIGLSLINKNKLKEAQKEYDNLMRDAAEFYDYKYEGIPLVHEIMKNMATCKTKLNQFAEALSLLDSTKAWQKGCEGNRSPNLIVTENLIRSIHESRGEKNLLRESEQEILKIKQSVTMAEIKFVKNSMMTPINLDQSSINIETTGGMGNTGNIQQSSISLDL